MRVRIQTQAPLPELKAWFVPDTLESIFGLKQALCQRVPALSTAQCLPENILLMLDGFELLDDSPFDAVRDGDLIVIKVSPGAEAGKSIQRKRKRDDATPLSVPAWRKTLQTPAKARANFSSSQGDSSSSSSSEEEESDSSASSASSSSSSSSSSTSSSSSSSSKSSSSSSSSSSESSSSSASSSPPRPQPTKKNPSTIAPTASSSTEKTNPTYGHVPPGAGKASTHARNRRRRVKREHDKAKADGGVPVVVPNGLSTTNTVPLGSRGADPASIPLPPSPARKKARVQESAADVEELARAKAAALASLESSANGSSASTPTPAPIYASPSEIMMISLRNKNKKKGFRLSMARPIPQKIVFGDDSSSQAPLEAQDEQEMGVGETAWEAAGTMQVDGDGIRSGSATPTASQPRPPLTQQMSSYQYARLVPPSDLYAQGLLPSNMIVTSVDVEAGMWDGPSKRRKKKKSKGKKEHTDEQWQYMDAEPDGYGYEDEGPMVLDYSEDAGAAGGGDGDEVDWAKAERAWDTGRPVTDVHVQLAPKSIVGWKALDLNPLTFTPEVLLKLARVVSVDAEQKAVVIRHLERSSSDLSLSYNSRAVSGFGFGGGDDEDGGEGAHEETRAWADILVDSWRLLDL